MLPGAGRRAGRDALGMLGGGGPAETPLSAVGRFASDGTASILPAGDATDIDMGKYIAVGTHRRSLCRRARALHAYS